MNAAVKRTDADMELLEDRLDRWARWRRNAMRPPTGGYGNPLAALHAEGAAAERDTSGADKSMAVITTVRKSIQSRITAAKGRGDQDEVARLQALLKKFPRRSSQLPWASLIHGTGLRRDPDFPEEEATELAINTLERNRRRAVHAEYRVWGTQEDRARRLGWSLSTYKRRLGEAMQELRYKLTP